MGITDKQVVGEYGSVIQRDTWADYDLHQVEAREPQEMGGDVGELRPDCPDEEYQGPHIPARWY